MENDPKPRLDMHTLLLCNDVAYLGITRNVLNQLHVTPRLVNTAATALAMIQTQAFDVIIVDWREIDSIAELLSAVRGSKLNHESVLVAIVRDLLDLRQAFAAGVHLLIHKPASAVQIERCLRTAYNATVARRRRHHREPVEILTAVSMHARPLGEASIVNVSEGGVKLRTGVQEFVAGVSLGAGDEVNLRFALPGSEQMLDLSGTVVWGTADACGVRFGYIPETQRMALQEWLTVCVKRSISRVCERIREACA